MRGRWGLVPLAILLAALAGLAFLFERQLVDSWLFFGTHPEVLSALAASLEDQKTLADLDPAAAEHYRDRFHQVGTLVRRLRVVEVSRAALVRRFELLLLGLFGGVLAVAAVVYGSRSARDRRRLEALKGALAELCAGRTDIRLEVSGRDPIGRVAGMIEETSRVMARDRRRLGSLENLSAWQEAARRHAHEMRTPLTAAQLEVDRLRQQVRGKGEERAVGEVADSLSQELERLAAFTRSFTSFARLPSPRRLPQDLAALVAEFVTTFGEAWGNLRLSFTTPGGGDSFAVMLDREMLRQVLVNLCDNSSQAVGEGQGTVTFRLLPGEDAVSLEVADDGPGVAAEIRRRLFEPYATTRQVGEGMGLGLAISKKILLDHGGDLELAASSPCGAAFRLVFPRFQESP